MRKYPALNLPDDYVGLPRPGGHLMNVKNALAALQKEARSKGA